MKPSLAASAMQSIVKDTAANTIPSTVTVTQLPHMLQQHPFCFAIPVSCFQLESGVASGVLLLLPSCLLAIGAYEFSKKTKQVDLP